MLVFQFIQSKCTGNHMAYIRRA